jgi:hypothetical protein
MLGYGGSNYSACQEIGFLVNALSLCVRLVSTVQGKGIKHKDSQ